MFKWLKKKPEVSISSTDPVYKKSDVLGYMTAILGANRITINDAIGTAKIKAEMLKEEALSGFNECKENSKIIEEQYRNGMAQVREKAQIAEDKEAKSSQIYDAIKFFNTDG
jgi:uncharacterized protein YfeS